MTHESFLRYRAYRHSGGVVQIAPETLLPEHLLDSHEHLVLVKPSFVGICSADVREVRGERPGRRDFGHEVVGRVAQSTHPRYAPGTSIALNPFAEINRGTGFAELMPVAGSADAVSNALLETPDDRMAFAAIEPLACVIHAARRAQPQRSAPTLIWGAGFFGYLLYRHLELKGFSVQLANRTPDRLRHLQRHAPDIKVVHDPHQLGGRFGTVFLMQTALTWADVHAAVPLLRQGGVIVLFGRVAASDDETLGSIRRSQRRVHSSHEGRAYSLQGTLDGTPEDLREALEIVDTAPFARALDAVLTSALSFEQGAQHLTRLAQSPRSLEKHFVDLRPRESHAHA